MNPHHQTSSITLKTNELNSTLIGSRRNNNSYLETINKAPSLNYDFSIHIHRPMNSTNRLQQQQQQQYHHQQKQRSNPFQQGIINRIHGMQTGCSNCGSTI